MARKKHEEEKEPNHERWMLSYADFITLLLIFFIILYSYSAIDTQKYASLVSGFNITMGAGDDLDSVIEQLPSAINLEDIEKIQKQKELEEQEKQAQLAKKSTEELEKDKLDILKSKVDQYIQANGLQAKVSTVIEDKGLVIRLEDTVLFDSGKADIKGEYSQTLVQIGLLLNSISNYIRVEGYTDNVPINRAEFPSNWELSVIRATNVTKLLIAQANINPARMSSIGYGEYRPIADNNSDIGRARNRRVDIVIVDSKYAGTEQD